MTGKEELLGRCKAFQAGNADEFRSIVAGAIAEFGLRQRELAAMLKVTPSTISRWNHAQQLPRPRLQKELVRHIERRLNYALRLKRETAT